MFMLTRLSGSMALPPACAPPSAVFSMPEVSSTPVRYPSALMRQTPRVTAPLSLRVFFSTKPAMLSAPGASGE